MPTGIFDKRPVETWPHLPGVRTASVGRPELGVSCIPAPGVRAASAFRRSDRTRCRFQPAMRYTAMAGTVRPVRRVLTISEIREFPPPAYRVA